MERIEQYCLGLLIFFFVGVSAVIAQKGPYMDIEWKYSDGDGNNKINFNEDAVFSFHIKNVGTARANTLKLLVSEQYGIRGLEYQSEYTLGRLSINNTKDIEVRVHAGPSLETGKALFVFQFTDGSGYRSEPLNLVVECIGAGETFSSGVLELIEPPETVQKNVMQEQVQEQLFEQVITRGIGDPLKGLNTSPTPATLKFGNYYALIIGIDNYSGIWTQLRNAVNDARAIENLLQNQYRFDYFRTLYNEQATRGNIIRELEWLVSNVREEDNVMIYFSGHGEFKQELNKGYWVPFDSRTNSTSGYISNSDIQTFLGGIRSKHTLLISDACFSGDIFRGTTVSVPFENSDRYYSQVHNLISRQALTSGGIEPVMDGGREGHSVFAYYLLKVLRGNSDKYFDASQLYNQIRIPVINNSEQSPKFQPIKNTGDEGGQFIFVKKQ